MPIVGVEAVDYDCDHLLILPPTSVVPQPILTIFVGNIAGRSLISSWLDAANVIYEYACKMTFDSHLAL